MYFIRGYAKIFDMLKIYIYGEPILRKKAKPISVVGEEISGLLEQMLEAMYQGKGIGLAAPQVGQDLRLIVVDVGSGPLKLCNPKILKKHGSGCMEEGCLSLPDLIVNVRRAKKVEVEALNEHNQLIKIVADDLLARAIQHEIDHLEGKLLVDYLPWYKRWLAKRRLLKIRRNIN